MKIKFLNTLILLTAFAVSLAAAPAAKTEPYNAGIHRARYGQLLNLAKKYDTEKLLAEVEKYLADKRFNNGMVYTCNLINAGFAAKGDPDKLQFPAAPQDLTGKEKDRAIYNAAKIFAALHQDALAAKMAATREKTPPVYECAIMKNAPVDATAWQQNKNIRFATGFKKYNAKSAVLLLNDEKTQTEKEDAACPVRFAVVADRVGINIYMEYKTDKTDEIFAGISNDGKYEMYLQPGQGEFYYQWLYGFRDEYFRDINWTTQTARYRPLKPYTKYKSVANPGKGINTFITIEWAALYDRLPDSKTEWKLGVIPWIAEGGFNWGYGQVHELNKFGTIKFPGIEKIMPDIKRMLVLKAWGKYKKESPDIITFWKDPVRGDVKFMEEKIQPLVTRLAEAGKEVKADMSDETVEKLFKETVADWNEFSHIVDQLRNDWLTESLINGK